MNDNMELSAELEMNQHEFLHHLKQFTRAVEGIERLVNAVMDHEFAVLDGDLPSSASLFGSDNLDAEDCD